MRLGLLVGIWFLVGGLERGGVRIERRTSGCSAARAWRSAGDPSKCGFDFRDLNLTPSRSAPYKSR